MLESGILDIEASDSIEINTEVLQRWSQGDIRPEEAEILPMVVLDLNSAREALLETVVYSALMFDELAELSRGNSPANLKFLAQRMAAHIRARHADLLQEAELTQEHLTEVQNNIRAFLKKGHSNV